MQTMETYKVCENKYKRGRKERLQMPKVQIENLLFIAKLKGENNTLKVKKRSHSQRRKKMYEKGILCTK